MRQKSKGYLINCLIFGNESESKNGGGGVMLYDNCEVNIISSTITDNHIAGPGGGIYRRQNTNLLFIHNSVISGNEQNASSTDVDAYETTAVAPVIKSSVIGSKVFDASGGELTESFSAGTMLNSSYKLVGENNPALKWGMNAAALAALGNTFNPPLHEKISGDKNNESRSGTPVMGAFVK